MKTTARKAMAITMAMARGTATMIGLAVMLAVVLGVGTTALAAVPGDPFKLGRINAVDAVTQLVGTKNDALLRIDNDAKGPDATALDLQVNPNKPPLKTNSLTQVENLHADLLDGRNANQFANGVDGTAVDADNLDGKNSTAFLGVNDKAKDAFNADFATFAGDAQNAQVAADADKLDGKDATAYFSTANTYFDTADAVTGQGGGTMLVFTGVPCDLGDRILNAGGAANPEDDMIEERPQGNNQWLVRIRDNGAPTNSTVAANCLDLPPLR